MRLAGKAALITGATSGIGEATAVMFAEEGAAVAVVGRDAGRGHAVEGRIRSDGGQAVFVRADVRHADECERAVDETVGAFGRLDVLFNNAGVYLENDTIGCSEEEWDAQVDTSLKGAFLMSKFALPHMVAQGSGSIVNCSSGWGLGTAFWRAGMERKSTAPAVPAAPARRIAIERRYGFPVNLHELRFVDGRSHPSRSVVCWYDGLDTQNPRADHGIVV